MHTRLVTFSALGVIMLTGCATVSDLRNEPPEAVYVVHQPVSVVAGCINQGWQSTTVSTTSSPYNGGRAIVVPNNTTNRPLVIADVTPVAAGSQVAIRANGSLRFYRDTIDKCVKQGELK